MRPSYVWRFCVMLQDEFCLALLRTGELPVFIILSFHSKKNYFYCSIKNIFRSQRGGAIGSVPRSLASPLDVARARIDGGRTELEGNFSRVY